MKKLSVGLGLLFLLACGSTVEPLGVQASPPSSLKLTNPADAAVFYFIVERGYAARINWGPCVDPRECRGVPPHGTTTVPYSQIGGYTSEAQEAIVYWWHLLPKPGGGFFADSVRGVVVQL